MPHPQNSTSCLPYQTTAVLFDLDNTLLDRDASFRAWAEVFVQNHFSAEAGREEIMQRIITLDNHGLTLKESFFAQVRQAYPSLQISVEQLVAHFRQEFHRYSVPAEGMYSLLHTLRDVHIPFGIVTNGSTQLQLNKIERLGLDKLTSCIFISQSFGAKKPAASIFLSAANYLDRQPENVLFVGDNPQNDIWGAHEVGMGTVWLQNFCPWPAHIPRSIADITISSLSELSTYPGFAQR